MHMYLARLPKRLEELELPKRYQMIVTPKLDVAFEEALREWVSRSMSPSTSRRAPSTGANSYTSHGTSRKPQVILAPNEYRGFPISAAGCELTRTVVVRTNGAVDDDDAGYPWPNNYVITEDHYIDYTGGRAPEEVVPTQILAKLHQASCLFLGYAIADWRLRVFLHWIWPGEKPNAAMRWAVDSNPSMIDRQTWTDTKVGLYQCRLTDYVLGLDRYLPSIGMSCDEHARANRSRIATTRTSALLTTTSNSAPGFSGERPRVTRSPRTSRPPGSRCCTPRAGSGRARCCARESHGGCEGSPTTGSHGAVRSGSSLSSSATGRTIPSPTWHGRSARRSSRISGKPRATPPADRLDLVIEESTRTTNTSLLIMLDQFEEYFLYRSREPVPGRFADQLAFCVNRTDLRANFLISIREDAYAGLGDLFKGRIANVYSNFLHIDYLDRASAAQAIRGPLAVYNAQRDVTEQVTIKDELVDTVLDEILVLDRTAGPRDGAAAANGHGARVSTPLLQLVMEQIWDTERAEDLTSWSRPRCISCTASA